MAYRDVGTGSEKEKIVNVGLIPSLHHGQHGCTSLSELLKGREQIPQSRTHHRDPLS